MFFSALRFGWCLTVLLLCVPLVACGPSEGDAPPSDADEREWYPLFNGSDLEGWPPKSLF